MAKQNTTKYKSNKQEKAVAKSMDARVTVASGALFFQKADVRSDEFLVECKTTSKTYYPLTLATWTKIEKQATQDGLRVPLMCIDLEDGKHRLAVISILDFLGLNLDLKAQYLGNPEPKLLEKNTFRVTSDFIYEDFDQEVSMYHYPCYRQDIKFLSKNKHLVILPFEDFVFIHNSELDPKYGD